MLKGSDKLDNKINKVEDWIRIAESAEIFGFNDLAKKYYEQAKEYKEFHKLNINLKKYNNKINSVAKDQSKRKEQSESVFSNNLNQVLKTYKNEQNINLIKDTNKLNSVSTDTNELYSALGNLSNKLNIVLETSENKQNIDSTKEKNKINSSIKYLSKGKEKTEEDFLNYIHQFLKTYQIKLDSDIMLKYIQKGDLEYIKSIDDLATYCAMLQDTIIDYFITIQNAFRHEPGRRLLDPEKIDSFFPSATHIMHIMEITKQQPELINYYKKALLASSDGANLLDNNFFKKMFSFFIQIDNVIYGIEKDYNHIMFSTDFPTIALEIKEYRSLMIVATTLIQSEVIDK